MRLAMSLRLVSSDCWNDCHPIALWRLFARGDAGIHVYSIAIAKISRWWIAAQGKPEPSTGTEERSSVASLCLDDRLSTRLSSEAFPECFVSYGATCYR
jgi:hypothetical protein